MKDDVKQKQITFYGTQKDKLRIKKFLRDMKKVGRGNFREGDVAAAIFLSAIDNDVAIKNIRDYLLKGD